MKSARDEGVGQSIEESVRELQIRLGVFKPDRIDFVGHCRRAGVSGARNLSEVAERNVCPHIGAQIVKNAICMANVLIELDLPVVRFDLGRQRVPR